MEIFLRAGDCRMVCDTLVARSFLSPTLRQHHTATQENEKEKDEAGPFVLWHLERDCQPRQQKIEKLIVMYFHKMAVPRRWPAQYSNKQVVTARAKINFPGRTSRFAQIFLPRQLGQRA